jgi:hypothetical protein
VPGRAPDQGPRYLGLRESNLAGLAPKPSHSLASLVVSAMVTNSATGAGTLNDLSVLWDGGVLRLSVRDHGLALPGQLALDPDAHVGFTVLAALSRAFGVLCSADGGKVVWAVFEAPRSGPATGNTWAIPGLRGLP